MKWKELFNLRFDDGGLTFQIGPIVLSIIVMAIVTYVILAVIKKRWRFWKYWEVVSAEINIGNLGTVAICPNYETVKVAYKAWIELVTRKATLPFDEENDVIEEVYDSWYQLFGRLRDFAKEIPAYQIRENEGTQKLIHIMVVVLNEGLRPHLTKWQARYRKWYESENKSEENLNLSPQEIQKKYPYYKELVEDLKRVNIAICEYAGLLRKIAKGEK